MKKTAFIISITLLLALAAGSVLAWGPGKGYGMWGSGYGGQSCPRFSGSNTAEALTTEQQEQLAALQQKFIDDTYELRSQMFESHQQIRLLMQTSSPDRAKLDAMYDEADRVQKQLRDKRIDFALEAKKIAPDYYPGYHGFGKGRGGYSRGCPAGGRGTGNCSK